MQLREYQESAIEKYNKFPEAKEILMDVPQRGGKSVLISEIANINLDLKNKVVIMTTFSELISQLKDHLKTEPKIMQGSKSKDIESSVLLGLEQTIHRRLDQLEDFKGCVILKDECFTPDVEILTENGWQRFDKLDKSIKVAQYNSETLEIDFINPVRYIDNKYSGDMYKIESNKRISFDVTPNHEIAFIQNGKFKKEYAKDFKPNNNKKIISHGKRSIKSEPLTQYEKLAIAFQADGTYSYIHHKTEKNKNNKFDRILYIKNRNLCSISFAFNKKRKIDLFRKDFKSLIRKESIDSRGRTIFNLSNIEFNKISKNLNEIFNIINFSTKKSIEFLEYLIQWDGSKKANKTTKYYYSSSVKENVDFIQSLSVIAGYKSNISIQIDNRKKTYKDIYRIWIGNHTSSFQKIKKEKYKYDGRIYCVTVPSGNIIIRRNGLVSISGNSQGYNKSRYTSILEYLKPSQIVHFNATPYTEKGYDLYPDAIKIKPITMYEMVEQGYIAKTKHFVPTFMKQMDFTEISSGSKDYTSEDIEKIMDTKWFDGDFIQWIKKLDLKNRNTLIIVGSIKMAEDINNLLIKNEITKDYKIADNIFDVKEPHKIDNQLFSAVVHSKRKDSNNDSMISKFQMGEIKVLISVSKLAIGFNSPIADTLINLRPTKIRRLFNQLVFRASTKYEGKTHAEHYDLGNCLLEHGFPEQSYEPPTDKHTKAIIDKALKIGELEVMLSESKDDDVEISPHILKSWKEDVRVLNNRRVEDLSLREIKKVYNSETDIYNLIKIALEASVRTSNNRYKDNSYEWICKPYREKEPTILEWDLVTRLVKKRMGVLLKTEKKITSIHFYLHWLINDSHIQFTKIEPVGEGDDNPFDIDEKNLPF